MLANSEDMLLPLFCQTYQTVGSGGLPAARIADRVQTHLQLSNWGRDQRFRKIWRGLFIALHYRQLQDATILVALAALCIPDATRMPGQIQQGEVFRPVVRKHDKDPSNAS